jgi:hypothetical protein
MRAVSTAAVEFGPVEFGPVEFSTGEEDVSGKSDPVGMVMDGRTVGKRLE